MVPGKTDSRWKEIITSEQDLPLNGLASKMMMMRVRTMLKMDSSDAKIKEAIDIAHEFFTKNEEMVKADLQNLFK
jgi:hypothetical protein